VASTPYCAARRDLRADAFHRDDIVRREGTLVADDLEHGRGNARHGGQIVQAGQHSGVRRRIAQSAMALVRSSSLLIGERDPGGGEGIAQPFKNRLCAGVVEIELGGVLGEGRGERLAITRRTLSNS